MTQQPRPTSVPVVDTLRLQLERSIDELAELARSDPEPGQFFAEVLKRALQPGGASHAILWRLTMDNGWESAGEIPTGPSVEAVSLQDRQELLAKIAKTSQPRILSPVDGTNGQTAADYRVFCPLRHAGQTAGILETRHTVRVGADLPPATIQFFAAIGEITADYLSQQELQQLRRARVLWQQWDQYSQQLGQSPDLDEVCAVIANEGRRLLGCDRVSVLVRHGRGFQLKAASGVERINVRAGSVRSLESLAGCVADAGSVIWQTRALDDAVHTGSDSDQQLAVIRKHASESGAACWGAIQIPPARADAGGSRPVAIIAFEQFQQMADWPDRRPHAEALVQRSASALRAAVERNAIPWLGLWLRIQKGPQILRRPTTLIGAVILLIVLPALILVPAELTVSGHGELWPDMRRDVFASSSGIVDQILVEHGTQVQREQPLIVLRDPQLDQESPRILGEIATVTERLKGVQAARLTGGGASESISTFRQLTADEEELKERLKTLGLQQKLIEERVAALTLRSPIAGRVLTWDVAQHLFARPVDRGQSLLTVGETDGPWIVEIRVADKDAGHLLWARRQGRPDLQVDFLLAAEPGKTYHGRIRDVSLTAESDDQSRGFVRVLAEFDRGQIEQLRPGATAIPRIRCGRRSIGYVWFHDLIDAIRTRLLF